MIPLTEEQLEDALREAHVRGYAAGQSIFAPMPHTEAFHDLRERAIQPLLQISNTGWFRDRSNHSVRRGHESLPCHCWAESDHPIGKEVSRECACADAKRFVWLIKRAQTGSIGFGEFVLYPGDGLDDVRAVIDSAMTSAQGDAQ